MEQMRKHQENKQQQQQRKDNNRESQSVRQTERDVVSSCLVDRPGQIQHCLERKRLKGSTIALVELALKLHPANFN